MEPFQDHYNAGPVVCPHTDDHEDTVQQMDSPQEVGGNIVTGWQGVPPATGPYDDVVVGREKESFTLGDGDMLQLSGSSGSEGDIGRRGGRRKTKTEKKKGLRERVKENMPGSKGGEHSHKSPTATPGGYYTPGEHSRPKGIMGKIKEMLLGPQHHHQLGQHEGR